MQALTSHKPPHPDDDAAEGWDVILSHTAVEEVQARLGALVVVTEVTRGLDEGGDRTERTLRHMDPLPFP